MRRAVALALLALAVATPAQASERHPTLGELEHEVMCPTCKTLLELSHAPIADRMRAFIRVRIRAGDTKSQIEAKLVAQFGEAVLASPPKRGFGLLAWLLPLGGLAAAAVGVAAVARRWARQPDPSAAAVEPLLERELDAALAALDD